MWHPRGACHELAQRHDERHAQCCLRQRCGDDHGGGFPEGAIEGELYLIYKADLQIRGDKYIKGLMYKQTCMEGYAGTYKKASLRWQTTRTRQKTTR